jgi:hypothetical protein
VAIYSDIMNQTDVWLSKRRNYLGRAQSLYSDSSDSGWIVGYSEVTAQKLAGWVNF